MVFVIDDTQKQPIDWVSGGPALGFFNFTRENIYVLCSGADSDLYSESLKSLSSAIANNPSIGLFLGCESRDGFDYFGFEFSEKPFTKFQPTTETFYQTKSVVLQIMLSVKCIHSKNIVHKSLSKPTSYIFYETDGKVTVKLSFQGCVKIGTEGMGDHTKKSNMEDLFQFFSEFFFGKVLKPGVFDLLYTMSPKELQLASNSKYQNLAYLALNARQTVKYVPRFTSKIRGVVFVYVDELIHFLYILKSCDSAESAVNHPFIWPLKNKMDFLVIVREHCSHLANRRHAILTAIDGINGFNDEAGDYWENFPTSVLGDLWPDPGTPGGPTDIEHFEVPGALKGSFKFLVALRNFYIHRCPREGAANFQYSGVRDYKLFSSDPLEGFDLIVGATVPCFFLNVYKIMKNNIDIATHRPFANYLDLSVDPRNFRSVVFL